MPSDVDSVRALSNNSHASRCACSGHGNGCRCKKCLARATSLPSRLNVSKEVREEIAILLKLGFVYTGPTSSGKHCFEHEGEPFLIGDASVTGKEVALSPSPSGRAWRDKHRHRVARLLGLNRWQLERVIAGQSIDALKRQKRPGRTPNEVVVMEHAMSLGIPCDRHQAERLIGRFGSTKAARRALDGMARAAQKQAA